MKKRLLLVLATFCPLMLTSILAAERIFGPEWEKQTFPDSEYVVYKRTVQVEVTHAASGNVSGYRLPLENGELIVSEIDNNRGFRIRAPGFGSFHVLKNENGDANAYDVTLGSFIYYDLDGDGRIDAITDKQVNEHSIIVEGRQLRVHDNKDGFNSKQKRSIVDKTTYYFRDGRWGTRQ